MPRGGKRAGAGRPNGAKTRKTQAVAKAAAKKGVTPLEYMLGILRNPKSGSIAKAWAAEKAAPYVHPRLASMQHGSDPDKPFKLIVEIIDPTRQTNGR